MYTRRIRLSRILRAFKLKLPKVPAFHLAQLPVRVLRYPPCFQFVHPEPQSAGAYMLDNPNMEGGDVLWLHVSCSLNPLKRVIEQGTTLGITIGV